MTLEEAQRKLAAAGRYRDMAHYISDALTRAALIDTANEFERVALPVVAPAALRSSIQPLGTTAGVQAGLFRTSFETSSSHFVFAKERPAATLI